MDLQLKQRLLESAMELQIALEAKVYGRSCIEVPHRAQTATAKLVIGGFQRDRATMAAAKPACEAYRDEAGQRLLDHLSEYMTKKITAGQLKARLQGELRTAYRQAFQYGLQASGWTQGVESADERWLKSVYRAEWKFLNGFITDMRNDQGTMSYGERLLMYRDSIDNLFWSGKVEGSPQESLIY